MKVALQDGRELDFPGQDRVTVREVACRLGVEAKALSAKAGDVHVPLDEAVPASGAIELLLEGSPAGLRVLRHSAAHVMADAVKRLFPSAHLAIGPAIEDGFYYDIEVPAGELADADLPRIEEEMRKIVASDAPFEREDLPADEARKLCQAAGEPFKVEIVDDFAKTGVPRFSFYKHGSFRDLCRGPHVPSTGRIKAFKLLSIAGAYWRGIETNPMLRRIYGTAFFSEKELREHLRRIEEAKKRDHRRIGKELDLFSFHDEAPGAPFWHPKGVVIYNALLDYCRSRYAPEGYHEVRAPIILNEKLWRMSGHWDHFKDNMFFTETEDVAFAVKPMNCPGHCLIFGEGLRSYRELPLRFAEYSPLHRSERSGALHGLTRVRAFCQDDAHIYCEPEQIEQEVGRVIALLRSMYRDLGFNDYAVKLATRPKSFQGSPEMWDRAEAALARALEAAGLSYEVARGEGAFYGPKIEFHIRDCLGRSWQCGTAQIDFSMPERFGLEYVGRDNQKHRPVMVHRAILGSFERMIAMLLEHTAGALPLWLTPEQVRVLPIADAHGDRAREVVSRLAAAGLRATGDCRSEKTGKKIREASLAKVPYMAVIGDREVADGTVALRHRAAGDLGASAVDALIARLKGEIERKEAGPEASHAEEDPTVRPMGSANAVSG